ncbi:response regulator [Niabella beijingensis]|uniref:response regulator n=1 Tax=Niabella beijingensis TaxID=2872700 RepID=UPI001CBE7D0D|nr:response regulator transcription factor [Niabella beijingensis]MBZ4189399.1 response regulator transcription factor [Niabella beijingensis]
MLSAKIKLAIVDDHPIVIEGLTNLLQKKEEIKIVGTFTSGHHFIDFLKQTAVQVVLLDVYLQDISGMDLCKEINAISPQTIILAFSNHDEWSAIMKMLENGARGYVLKSSTIEELLKCINEAISGEITFSSAVKEIISQPPKNDKFQENIKLTNREKEILALIASGMTTTDIAKQLFLSKFTIDGHRKNLLQKFSAKNAVELINAAKLHGFL